MARIWGNSAHGSPALYGTTTLSRIEASLEQRASAAGHELDAFQSEAEADLIRGSTRRATRRSPLILFNPAAFTHTSIALRDALLAVQIPFIELHLSNVAAREDFRQRSFFSDVAIGTIAGFGVGSYELALDGCDSALGAEGQIVDIQKSKKTHRAARGVRHLGDRDLRGRGIGEDQPLPETGHGERSDDRGPRPRGRAAGRGAGERRRSPRGRTCGVGARPASHGSDGRNVLQRPRAGRETVRRNRHRRQSRRHAVRDRGDEDDESDRVGVLRHASSASSSRTAARSSSARPSS